MNTIFPRNRAGRLGLLFLFVALLVGVAAVAAQQNEPADPNQPSPDAPAANTDANPLTAEEMAGRSPNDVLPVLDIGAQNDLPIEEMVGRSPNGDDDQAQAAPDVAPDSVQAVAAGGGRRFFVTYTNTTGPNADTHCPAGYHLASLYELSDPTELTYVNFAGARTKADQGSGPVAGWWGWVRTGGNPSTANVAGQANCNVWASGVSGEYGTLVQLTDVWTGAGVAISPWRAQTWSCAGQAPSWCVAD